MPGRETTPPTGTTAKQDDIQLMQKDNALRKQMLARKKQMMMKQQTLDRQRLQAQQQGQIPIGHTTEEVEYDLEEKTLTSVETKKKEEIVKSMKKSAGDFEKRYPGRGKEVMYATATKMAKKVAEGIEQIDERRRGDKGNPGGPEPSPAFKAVSKMMGSGRMGVKPRGEKKVPGQKPPAAGEYGAQRSPAQKVAMRRAAAQRAQDMMHSPRD
jgi:hypothetical protein